MSAALDLARDGAASADDELRRRNRELYDDTDTALWERAVFGGMHGGRRFINLGGEAMLRRILHEAARPDGRTPARILDLGAGNGAVAAWLADTTGAHVTAVEINARQAERARDAAGALRRGSVEVVEDDAARVRFAQPFDLVVAIDTLMLVPDWRGFLAVARAAMAPQGLFSAATILDGGLTASERAFFAAEDGMVSLPTCPDACQMLRGVGFSRTACETMSDIAAAAMQRLDLALEAGRADIVGAVGAAPLRQWVETNRLYLQAFAQRRLHYVLLHARL